MSFPVTTPVLPALSIRTRFALSHITAALISLRDQCAPRATAAYWDAQGFGDVQASALAAAYQQDVDAITDALKELHTQ